MKKELVIVIDFGGQYNQLVARRVRECNVYCEIYSYKTDLEKIKAMNPKGIILTGGPNSCYEADSPTYQKELFELGVPVLGLCYGAQLMMHVLGGKVEKADVSEYGKTELLVDKTDSKIFENVSKKALMLWLRTKSFSSPNWRSAFPQANLCAFNCAVDVSTISLALRLIRFAWLASTPALIAFPAPRPPVATATPINNKGNGIRSPPCIISFKANISGISRL